MSDRSNEPPRRIFFLMGLLGLFSAGMDYLSDGISVTVVFYTCFALVFLAGAAGVVDSHKEGKWVGTLRGRLLLVLGVLVLAAAAYFADDFTVNGRTLFAGPLLRDVLVSSSQTASAAIAAPGHRFLLFDAEVVSYLGTPLRSVFYGDFELEFDGRRVEPAPPSLKVPGACDGFDVSRWGSRRCTVVFEVPTGVEVVRLRMGDFRQWVHSGDLDVRHPPQADIPRVELVPEVQFASPSTRFEGLKRVDLLVELRPLDGAAPLALEWLVLRDASGGSYLDRSDPEVGGCSELLVEHELVCNAIYYVPMELNEARLTFTTYGNELPGAFRSAGVETVRF